MTKKEQQRLADLERDLRLAKAFRFTEAAGPDVPIPDGDELAKGWLFGAYISGEAVAERACSSAVSHSFGNDDRTTTHRPRRLFSTKLKALLAARVELEKQCAEKLANLDEKIQEEKTKGATK